MTATEAGLPQAAVNPELIERLLRQLLQRWTQFPDEQLQALRELLSDALTRACSAEPQVLTVTNPVSRPQRLRLATLVSDPGLDTMYQREWAELAVSSRGDCYLVYRRLDGGDYAIEWSPATTLPTTMFAQLPECLALALLDSDNDPD